MDRAALVDQKLPGPPPPPRARTAHAPPAPGDETADLRGRAGLGSRGFVAMVVTQFLVALNDNMFRWLIVPIGKDLLGTELALSVGLACFTIPYLLLMAPAGYISDRFSKRTVMVVCKVAEIAIMALGVAAILAGNVYGMFVVLFAMGAQSAFFSPSKYGSIPELVRADRIPAANGVVSLTTMLAIILGALTGGYLYAWTTVDGMLPGTHHWWISASALLGVAALGYLASLLIAPLRAANPTRPFPRNAAAQTWRDLAGLFHRRPLFAAAFCSAFFWLLGAMVNLNIDLMTTVDLGMPQERVGPLLALLMLGIGGGALAAGFLSRGKIELGMVPFGALGIAVTSALLYFLVPTAAAGPNWPGYLWAGGLLFLLGSCAGLYDIPLQAYLQHHSPDEGRGRIMAAGNFLAFSGILLASGLFWLLTSPLGVSARGAFLVASVGVLVLAAAIVASIPAQTVRFVLTTMLRLVYRVRVRGLENIPATGGALLTPNHLSYVDGLLILLVVRRPVRAIVYADYIDRWYTRWLARHERAIPIGRTRKQTVEAIRTARAALADGDLVCIFPEGGLSRTGQMQAFQPGLLSVLKGTDVPVIPIFLAGLWGSIFSFSGGKFFWKLPRRWPYPVTLAFGEPLRGVKDSYQVRRAVEDLGYETTRAHQQVQKMMILPRKFLRNCRRKLFHPKVADSTGMELSGGSLLARTLILRRLLRREVLADDESHVGLLLPPTVACVVANAALSVDRRITVNLNYTAPAEVVNACIRQAGIRHVLTSRKVLERFPLEIDAEWVFLEDFKEKVTTGDKLAAAVTTYLLPSALLERCLGLTRVDPDDVLTVIFTSGSTGDPKGVMLTHRNVGSNVEAVNQIIHLTPDDVLLGILPIFHSFGYTTTLWTVLTLPPKGVYHTNPLEARQVGAVCREHGVTIMVTTPTFVRSYLRRCEPEDFSRLDVVFTGAEKLPKELADAFEARFGVRPVEGYGTTELSPVVSGNVPPSRQPSKGQKASKEGSVGRPLPDVYAKVVDLDTGNDLGYDKSGMLLVKGPNVMKGYLGRPDLTAEAIRDGWYVTGDVAVVDSEGFIHITGRESRFSKIAGEMVPHIHIEEAINKAAAVDEEELRVAVTSVPDAKKGERLIVLYTTLPKTPEEICRVLTEAGLPQLWIPSPDSFLRVETIPVLGTGKLDLRAVRHLAEEQCNAGGSAASQPEDNTDAQEGPPSTASG